MNVVHSDRAIAKKLLRGDEQAFRQLFDGFFPKLYRFALARLDGNQDEAKEVVQRTFCKAFERLDSYRGEASLYAWMCQILRNTILDLVRKRQRDYSHVTLLEDDTGIQGIIESLSAPESDQPDHYNSRLQMVRLIQATLDGLPGHYGDVLEWKYVEGMSVKEIAERLAVGPKAAESLLTRARHAFRETVQSIGGAAELLPIQTGNAVKG